MEEATRTCITASFTVHERDTLPSLPTTLRAVMPVLADESTLTTMIEPVCSSGDTFTDVGSNETDTPAGTLVETRYTSDEKPHNERMVMSIRLVDPISTPSWFDEGVKLKSGPEDSECEHLRV
jgi:hypothetical protein